MTTTVRMVHSTMDAMPTARLMKEKLRASREAISAVTMSPRAIAVRTWEKGERGGRGGFEEGRGGCVWERAEIRPSVMQSGRGTSGSESDNSTEKQIDVAAAQGAGPRPRRVEKEGWTPQQHRHAMATCAGRTSGSTACQLHSAQRRVSGPRGKNPFYPLRRQWRGYITRSVCVHVSRRDTRPKQRAS